MEEKKQAELYDEFVTYVQKKMRDTDNPNLSVREFDLRQVGTYDMQLTLENVDSGKRQLYDLVERFKPGATLETKEDIHNGDHVFVATIPFKKNQPLKRGKKAKKSTRTSEASTSGMLIFYGFSMMSLVVLAALKTTRDEWSWLF